MIKIKLDENLSWHLKEDIQKLGFEVKTSADEGLLGRSDVEVGAAARSEGKVLFTLDIEFADLRKFPPGSHSGIVLFRPQSMGPMTVSRFVLKFLEEVDLADMAGCVVVVEPNRIRLRRPSSDSDLTE